MPGSFVTRYAPSPTGYLHLGHVAHTIYVWGVAEAMEAAVLLRIEDHDRRRCRPEFEEALIEDLAWLGFEPANVVGRPSDFRQSDNEQVYEAALRGLGDRVYRCSCTRKQIAERCPLGPDGERVYDGFCRDQKRSAGGWRVRLDPNKETFIDGVLGRQSQTPAQQCGDVLIRDRYRQWTYQFAVVVDDLRHGVNLVIRGEDLLASTGRQIQLARLLGREEPPLFHHHPLILDERGRKLSKRTAGPPIRDLRKQGRSAEEVLGEAAFRAGLTAKNEPLSARR